MESKNIFGQPLIACSHQPLTGYFRDGCCSTDDTDLGVHTVCIVATEAFLTFSKLVGNDLSTPLPQYAFPGVKVGDKWCLCALRFKEAFENNAAPKVLLEATNEKTLEIIDMKTLVAHAHYAEKA
jgi:uncharacterized protein (DUF2237 family)